ncbi:MAG: glycosyltransferase family 39 protein [Sphingobacteriales bacterium JAD_PAG50586_3]|nr:MAG: glycosyltransferase family 39 protein [Sphingobacteriales bacterium JAD_PAG50586_3]
MLFWLSALMFKLFGVSNIAYKLPSFIFTLFGVYATYALGKKLYTKQTGQIAALMLYGCQAWYSFNNDVRTDTMLAASVIMAVWALFEYIDTKKWLHFITGFTFVALGMLSKGPLGLMVPALALGTYLLYKRDFKSIFNPRWLIGLGIIGIILAPMVYGLYQQYGKEGPLFFFWTQSFGRITGENVWKNDAGYFFFVHTYLWAFLPFSFVGLWAWGSKAIRIVKSKMHINFANDVLLLAGFTLPFIALSMSQYKLPHYIFVVFPFIALISADWLLGFIWMPLYKTFRALHLVINITAFILIGMFCLWFFPLQNVLLWIVIVVSAILIMLLFIKITGALKIILPSLFALCLFNLVMNAHVYPQLLKYHSTSVMAHYVVDKQIPVDKIKYYHVVGHAFDFYARTIVVPTTPDTLQGDVWLVTDEAGYNEVKAKG